MASKDPIAAIREFLVRIGLGIWAGILAGIASWAFLAALVWATATQSSRPWLLLLLPVAGAAIAWAYERWGSEVAGGNDLLLERIHDPGAVVPFRMVPLILATTVATHLFGGSAGREGTAVQMGGTLGQLAASLLKLRPEDRRLLIMAGIAGGFGAVFGTPFAGAVFAIEVLAIGRFEFGAFLPCLAASLVGDVVARALGTRHHDYAAHVGALPTFSLPLLGLILFAGGLFGLAAAGFVELTHFVRALSSRLPSGPARAALGGVAVVALTLATGSRDYNGLSLPLLETSFVGRVALFAFALKIVFTAITLGTGFKGGEVTPLFVIGATLGNAFAGLTGQPLGLFAALGFAAVFAGAANTPVACVIMGMELFGSRFGPALGLACAVAYLFSGHRGIYGAQRVHRRKGSARLEEGAPFLRDLRGR